MNLYFWGAAVVVSLLIFFGPFLIGSNSLAQSMFGLITTAIATGIGVWASWSYSRNSDKERLTRYGLLAWRNVDALSVKVRQQIQVGSASPEMLQSWMLDIDQAKCGWRDLLRELFELQERLELEREEISQKYKAKIDNAESASERKKLEDQSRLELAKISAKAPLPFPERLSVGCPNCGKSLLFTLGTEPGTSAWPTCDGCGAVFPVHRRTEGEVYANPDAMKLPISRNCPYCDQQNYWKVPVGREVAFLCHCSTCKAPIQCRGSASTFTASIPEIASVPPTHLPP